jgi:hypothetical protein
VAQLFAFWQIDKPERAEYFRIEGMSSRQTKLNPLLQSLVAMVLFVWLAAVTACTTECFGEGSHSESAHMDQIAMTNNQPHDSGKHDSHDDSFCVSLHSLCPAPSSLVLTKPDFGLAFTLDFISTAQLVAFAQPKTAISRQPPDDELVFTPEVSLSAAFYSLAPPVLA